MLKEIVPVLVVLDLDKKEQKLKKRTKPTPHEDAAYLAFHHQTHVSDRKTLTAKIHALLQDSEAASFHGSILVATGGEILFHEGFGKANTEMEIPNSPKTIFPLGSLTKQFTSMAIMQLYERGKIHIYDKLSTYLPDFPRGDEITLKHLMTHTSGIMDYTYEDAAEFLSLPVEDVTVDNIIKIMAQKPLKFIPGKKYSYSNTGYLILGRIIEIVSGQSYEQYLKGHIFRPLGMDNTGAIFSQGEQNYQTKAYSSMTAEPIACDEHDLRGAFSAGGLYSTTGDLFLWAQALGSEALLSSSNLDLMFMPHKAMNESFSYAFGWVLEHQGKPYGRKFYHGGAINGFTANLSRYVDRDITIIILANGDQFSLITTLETKILELICG